MKNIYYKISILAFIFSLFIPYSYNLILNKSYAKAPVFKYEIIKDTVSITVNCSECEKATAGQIIVDAKASSWSQKKSFTNLQKNNPLVFKFEDLQLNSDYSVILSSTGKDVYLYYLDNNGKSSITSSFSNKSASGTSEDISSDRAFKTTVNKTNTVAEISITCYQMCGAGLRGSFTLKGDNYSETSMEKSFSTQTPVVFTFKNLVPGNSYTLSGVPRNSNNTEIKFNDFTFVMDKTTNVVANEVTYIEPIKGGDGNVLKTSNVYEFLAPIGKITSMYKECDTSKLTCINYNIGDYLNFIFKFLIGLAAALAVIMLIIAGITYMGDESVFGKTEAKSKMFNAILGLLIALGSWALLNTINPDLTGAGGLSIDQVSVEIDEETELKAFSEYNIGDNKILCPDGYKDVLVDGATPSKINVCNSIHKKLSDLILEAKNSKTPIILSGYGSRSSKRQQELRVENGCPNPSTPSNKCSPPTARPGRSMHESGLAVDFTCNGKSMMNSGGKESVCFIWLSKNAMKYGLKNFDKEPWHWSTNGK